MPNLWDDSLRGVVLLQPKNRWTVRFASRDPMAKPEIDPRYLSEIEDVDTSIAGLRIPQHVAQADILKPWAETIFSAPNASDAELAASVPGDIGTVRMGAGDGPAAGQGHRCPGGPDDEDLSARSVIFPHNQTCKEKRHDLIRRRSCR